MRKANAGSRRYEVLDVLRDNPEISLNKIGKKLNMSPVLAHFHVHMLEEEGWIRITYKNKTCMRFQVNPFPMPDQKALKKAIAHMRESQHKQKRRRLMLRYERGDVAMPRMTPMEQMARIEMVVAKAIEKDECRMKSGDEDVVRVNKSPWSLRACKLG